MPSVAVAGGLDVNASGAGIDSQVKSDSAVAASGIGGRVSGSTC